jgi:hypothetical protein
MILHNRQYRENSSFDEVFAKSVMGAAFKNNEKVLQRHWAAIAADKWNEAGKLWLKSNVIIKIPSNHVKAVY